MYNGKRILGLVPARGGSKGLPRKNILPLLGKPLIVWTIEQAMSSLCIDRIFVSTDDEEIAETSRKAGVEVPFLRPAELARDDSPTIDTIIHTLDYCEVNEGFDILALLEPTSPLRKREDIDSALKLLVDNLPTAEAVVSVGEVHTENPFITKIIDEGLVIPFLAKQSKAIFQRQQLPKVYFPYGVIYAATSASLRAQRTFYQERTLSYTIERWQNYEIDDPYDFLCIEAIMKNKMKEIA
jgi:CMP-N,N'-diacetyllegionaminic acid synthase